MRYVNVALTRRQHHLQITKSHCTSFMILFQTLTTKTMIIDHRQNHDHKGVAVVIGKARRSTQVQVDLNFPGPQG